MSSKYDVGAALNGAVNEGDLDACIPLLEQSGLTAAFLEAYEAHAFNLNAPDRGKVGAQLRSASRKAVREAWNALQAHIKEAGQ